MSCFLDWILRLAVNEPYPNHRVVMPIQQTSGGSLGQLIEWNGVELPRYRGGLLKNHQCRMTCPRWESIHASSWSSSIAHVPTQRGEIPPQPGSSDEFTLRLPPRHSWSPVSPYLSMRLTSDTGIPFKAFLLWTAAISYGCGLPWQADDTNSPL